MGLTTEQLRVLEDSAVAYDRWIGALRELDALGPALRWKTIEGRDYLYELRGSSWGSSRGARAPETEQLYAHDTERRTATSEIIHQSRQRLDTLASLYRALRLPRVHPVFGEVCREADRRGLMGNSLLVVGTNAMPVYEIESQERFSDQLMATADCDFAWVHATQLAFAAPRHGEPRPLYSMLKAVDSMFTVNMEREYQARNAEGYEVEFLLAPSQAQHYPAGEPLRPIPLPEQEWLLLGRRVEHVVFDMSGKALRLVVPDPRWMALHKLWLADKPERNPLKKPKDRAQGELLAQHVVRFMPGFPIDAEFKQAVPPELLPYLNQFPR